MKMRYKKAMGVIYIAMGTLFSCIYFLIALNGGKGSVLLTMGFVVIMFGVLFLTRTYFVVNDDSLVLNAILGPAKTTYKFQSVKDLEIDENKVYITQNGKRQKINISAWMVDKRDWQAFKEKIKSTTQNA
jgi:hypothetical protein